MDSVEATNPWRGMIPRYRACQGRDFSVSSILPDTFAPSSSSSSSSRLPSGFSERDEFSRPSSSFWHQCSELPARLASRFYTYIYIYVHLRDSDIMNVNASVEPSVVLTAANILIWDTCSRRSKTYLADEDYRYRNRIKRLALIPSEARKREIRFVIRSASASHIQR